MPLDLGLLASLVVGRIFGIVSSQIPGSYRSGVDLTVEPSTDGIGWTAHIRLAEHGGVGFTPSVILSMCESFGQRGVGSEHVGQNALARNTISGVGVGLIGRLALTQTAQA